MPPPPRPISSSTSWPSTLKSASDDAGSLPAGTSAVSSRHKQAGQKSPASPCASGAWHAGHPSLVLEVIVAVGRASSGSSLRQGADQGHGVEDCRTRPRYATS